MRIHKRIVQMIRGKSQKQMYIKGWEDGYWVGRADKEKPYLYDPLALVKHIEKNY